MNAEIVGCAAVQSAANSGGGNICYGGAPCTTGTTPKEKVSLYTFEYFSYGNWKVGDLANGGNSTTLFDTDTAAAGARVAFTLTGPEAYSLTVTPLGSAPSYTRSGSLSNTGSGPINWVELEFFNTATDPGQATDFYVSNMQVVPEPATFSLLVCGAGALIGGRRLESANNVLGSADEVNVSNRGGAN
jgi:hypothetical protein